MAMTGTDPNLYMSYSSDNNNNGHQSRRLPIGSFSWNQVVRGESEPIAAATSSSSSAATPSPPSATVVESLPSSATTLSSSPVDNSSSSMGESLENGNCYDGNMVKRPAWNKPSNGAVSEVKPVMGADSWPALSESTRITMKSSSESLKTLTDVRSVPQLQVNGNTTSSSQRQISDNANTNNVAPACQNSAKSDCSGASSDSSHTQQSAPQTPTAATGSHNSFPKDHTHRIGSVPQPHNVNDHPQQRTFRNRNSGSYLRGESSHHHNHGSRREQGRGNQDWNTHRNFNSRDTHIPQRNFQRFARPPPPPSPHFFPPPQMRPSVHPLGYPEPFHQMLYYAPPQDSGFFYVPLVPPQAMVPPAPNLQLHAKIVAQIDYYFSPDNLIKDTYLRQKMDDQGWVPIKIIAGFKRVMYLTDNIQLILEALQTSSVVEVQGDKVRRQNDWLRWILPTTVEFPQVTSHQTHGSSSHDMLAEQVRSVSLDETNKNAGSGDGQPNVLRNKPSFGDLNSPEQHSSSEETGQVGMQASDHSVSARNPL